MTYGCRLVADTFLEAVDDLGSAAMSDEMAEVLRLTLALALALTLTLTNPNPNPDPTLTLTNINPK